MSFVVQYSFPTTLPWTEKLVSKLSERSYRHAYMVEGVKTWIARQARTLREQRGWSQEDLGRRTDKPQSAISRVEDPDYGKVTLQTLFDLAKAYDLPLLVQFVEWSDWLSRMSDTSTEALQRESFSAVALRDVGSGQVFIEPKLGVEACPIPEASVWSAIYHGANSADINFGVGTIKLGTVQSGKTWLTGTTVTASAAVIYGRRVSDPYKIEFHEDDVSEFEKSFGHATMHGALEVGEVDNG